MLVIGLFLAQLLPGLPKEDSMPVMAFTSPMSWTEGSLTASFLRIKSWIFGLDFSLTLIKVVESQWGRLAQTKAFWGTRASLGWISLGVELRAKSFVIQLISAMTREGRQRPR